MSVLEHLNMIREVIERPPFRDGDVVKHSAFALDLRRLAMAKGGYEREDMASEMRTMIGQRGVVLSCEAGVHAAWTVSVEWEHTDEAEDTLPYAIELID